MPGPCAVQNLQMPHPWDWQGAGQLLGEEGGLGTVELTDALSVTSINTIDLVMVLEAKHDE